MTDSARVIHRYWVQPGCHNCRHAEEAYTYDGPTTLYCGHGAPPRPPCGSVLMDEAWPGLRLFTRDKEDKDKYAAGAVAWREWSAGREVEEAGCCGCWEERDEPERTNTWR